jgi:hypothetical protein
VNANAISYFGENSLRGLDLNQRPSGYEPDELPGCSTPRLHYVVRDNEIKLKNGLRDNDSTNQELAPAVGFRTCGTLSTEMVLVVGIHGTVWFNSVAYFVAAVVCSLVDCGDFEVDG